MEYLLTGAEMSACDRRTSEVIGIPSLVLMERAALSVADGVDRYLRGNPERKPINNPEGNPEGNPPGNSVGHPGRSHDCAQRKKDRKLVLAVAGRGNNGADALAAGRILLDRGYKVFFCRLSGEISPDSSFAVQEKILRQYGCEVLLFRESVLNNAGKYSDEAGDPETAADTAFSDDDARERTAETAPQVIPDVIIDGLLGTGLSRALTGEAAECVAAVNRFRSAFGTYVVAVDIPSGISSDDGSVMGCAVECDETRTFAFYKRGHFLFPGAAYAGKLHLAQIGITARAFEKMPGMFTFSDEKTADLLPARSPDGNKGTFGKVLIIAGRKNMCGAAVLAARACMAAGAGMVKIFTEEANRLLIQSMLPEALLETFCPEEPPSLMKEKLIASTGWADIAAAGPAMGTDEAASFILRILLEEACSSKRIRGIVLDADALRILAGNPVLEKILRERPADLPCILTPHLAEFAALAGCRVQDCLKDRASIVQAQADRFRCTIVCKDARTLVVPPGASVSPLYLNTCGNSGMATAGSGDVLTGMTAAILASFEMNRPFPSGRRTQWQRLTGNGFAPACSAVFLHGKAGDEASRTHGERAMTAGDLVEALRKPGFWN